MKPNTKPSNHPVETVDSDQTSAAQELRDEISQLARKYWEADGQPSGRDLDYWLSAEKDVLRRRSSA